MSFVKSSGTNNNQPTVFILQQPARQTQGIEETVCARLRVSKGTVAPGLAYTGREFTKGSDSKP